MVMIQWIFLVLTLVQIHASKYHSLLRAEPDACPDPDIVFCDYVQCENGHCEEDKASSECFKCQCEAGFTGKLCETAIATPTGCNPSCLNGGQCEQTGANTFACVCPQDFTGSQCEISLIATHPCITMPATVCQNGGTCSINDDGFLCNCPTGWTGTNCEQQEVVTQCELNTCGAHGICIQAIAPSGPVVFCNCENRWTGKFCDVNLDDICPAGFCLSGGTCVTVGNTPTCQCPPTHTGIRCETLLGTGETTMTTLTTTTSGTMTTTSKPGLTPVPGNCANKPCENGGSCFNTGNHFVCLCNHQWTGELCDMPNSGAITTTTTSSGVNPCSSNPCNNGGTCRKHGVLGFICVCTSDFTGATCTVPKTTTPTSITTGNSSITCVNRPCQNGGTCYNTGNSYFCYCGSKSLFTGKNCETPITALSADCPLNCSPGQCVRTGSNQNAYACMCNGVLNPTSCPSN